MESDSVDISVSGKKTRNIGNDAFFRDFIRILIFQLTAALGLDESSEKNVRGKSDSSCLLRYTQSSQSRIRFHKDDSLASHSRKLIEGIKALAVAVPMYFDEKIRSQEMKLSEHMLARSLF